jgi:hypothetical protein
MKDRIQIDGVWYVRELETEPKTEFLDVEINTSLSAHYENEDYSWEAIRMYKDDNETFYEDFDVKFTDKNTKPWKEDYWDNTAWIKGVYENNPDSTYIALEEMDENGLKHFRSFLNELKKLGWF